jgi:MoaA/NifB/PqqE/SkfB family radical SAM enzyme
MDKTTDIVQALGFDDKEIGTCLTNKGLLSIELEFTRRCNLRCGYCYSNAGEPADNELGIEEIKSVIEQAKEMGARKVILLGGGEPLMYPGLREVVHYISSAGLQQVLFTNGTLINKETARFLFDNDVYVIIKSNSRKPEVQDMLAGVKDASRGIRRGLDLLMEAGYPSEGAGLGIQSVICRQNIDELPEMWIWARERNIVPYFEILTHQGRAKENTNLSVTVDMLKTVFEQLELIDKERFAILWSSRPTIAAFSCKRHLYSCLINSQGYVQPCTGIDLQVGNIRTKSLRDVLNDSPEIRDLRNIYENIEGRCKTCEHSGECYGCRGNAYQITGDYLASDPTCWRCEKGVNEDSACLCKQ